VDILDVQFLINRITVSCLEKSFTILVREDVKYGKRLFLQIEYVSVCNKTGREETWKGRKHYLSSHMTEDEVVKTAYVAFKQTVEHEIMEGFKVDGTIPFNPHIDYKALLEVSHKEVTRETDLKTIKDE